MQEWFVFYNYCIPTRGAVRSLVCDLDKQDFFFISTSDYDKIKALKVKKEDSNVELLDYLVHKEVGFYTDTPDFFPSLTNEYLDYSLLDNLLIEIEDTIQYLAFILKDNSLGIKYMEIRYLSTSVDLLLEALSLISASAISSVSLCINKIEELSSDAVIEDFVEMLNLKHKELDFVALFNQEWNENKMIGAVFLVKKKTPLSNFICGEISPVNFNLNMKSFQQAMNCNVCLDKKIAIDKEGKLKNCLSMLNDFGKVTEVNIREIIASNQWKKKQISKDEISICKDCEFRYICHDCRAFLADDELTKKPVKCKYNPYTTKWGE